MANHSIDIYYFTPSPPCRALFMVVKALGIKHNIKIVNILAGEQMNPDFLKMNPMHTIPTIKDGEFIMWDSHVIMKYLVDQYAKDDSLYPRDPKKAAVVSQRLFFHASHLSPRFLHYAGPVLFYNQQPDDDLLKKLEESLQFLDGFLSSQTWVAGQNMTVADFAIIATVSTIEATGVIDLTKFENVWSWFQRSKGAMASFGYEENQSGADQFGAVFKTKLKSI